MNYLSAFLYGLCYGSFLNVAIYRLPRDQSLVKPRSRCTHCHKFIAFYDNIPLASWLILRGKCRNCGKPISARYPAVELATALLCVVVAWRWEGAGLWVIPACVAAGILLAVTLIDFDTFLIPDPLSLGLLALSLATAPLNPLFSGGPGERLLESFIGGLVGFAMTWFTAVAGEKMFKKEALGGGDIKLLAAVGALTGATGAFSTLMVGSALGASFGIWQMWRGKLERSEPIPFGPFLSIGALAVLLDLLPKGFPFFLTAP